MFENLSDRLGGVFDRLTKQGALSEDDVAAAMREVRVAPRLPLRRPRGGRGGARSPSSAPELAKNTRSAKV